MNISVTFFTIPKPFTGKNAINQRNAIDSWKRILPECEIILFGNEEGISDYALEKGFIHIAEITCNQYGTPFLSDAFKKAQEMASGKYLCYVNADIIFLSGFSSLFSKPLPVKCLVVGKRSPLDISSILNEEDIKKMNDSRSSWLSYDHHSAIDYFIFPNGQLNKIPPFIVGRAGWDNWMIWYHKKEHIPVIDASPLITAVHQEHDYSHIKQRSGKRWEGIESDSNRKYLRKWYHQYYTILDADYSISADGNLKKKQIDLEYIFHWLKRGIASLIPYKLYQTLKNYS